MRNANDFVTPEARYEEREQEMSGVNHSTQGMAPAFPLYGFGQVPEGTPVVWYQRPRVVFAGGLVVGVGLGYLVFGMFIPRFMPKLLRPNRKKKLVVAEED